MQEQHESSHEQAQPAANIRVPSEELAQAIPAIDAHRREEARQKQRAQAPPPARTVRTIHLTTERAAAPPAADNEYAEDGPIETLHRSTGTETRVLIGVLIVALLLCLLGLAVSLTSTPPRPTLPLNPRPIAPKHQAQTMSGAWAKWESS